MKSLIRLIIIISLTLVTASAVSTPESICYGTTRQGRLEFGVSLPTQGSNFTGYSMIGVLAGRTYVHSNVRDVTVAAYDELKKSAADKVYVYGETGWPAGGTFKPHKTHQNGLSIDFMVPVLKQGDSVPLPTTVSNRFGYDIEFDSHSRYHDYVIDYEAMAAHLVALHQASQAKGVKIWRVIFDPKLQTSLFKTSQGAYLKRHLSFSKKPSWVRHDEHYHVDFIVPCRPLEQ